MAAKDPFGDDFMDTEFDDDLSDTNHDEVDSFDVNSNLPDETANQKGKKKSPSPSQNTQSCQAENLHRILV